MHLENQRYKYSLFSFFIFSYFFLRNDNCGFHKAFDIYEKKKSFSLVLLLLYFYYIDSHMLRKAKYVYYLNYLKLIKFIWFIIFNTITNLYIKSSQFTNWLDKKNYLSYIHTMLQNSQNNFTLCSKNGPECKLFWEWDINYLERNVNYFDHFRAKCFSKK